MLRLNETRLLKTTFGLIAAASLAALVIAPMALGQAKSAAQISLTEGDAPYAVTIVGPVRAEVHQTSMFSKTPLRDLADAELRKQAAKMGADAVVKIIYEPYSALTSKKGFVATGVAVKYQTAPGAPPAQAAQAPAPVPAAPAPQQYAAAPAPMPAATAMRRGPTPASAIQLSESGIGVRYVELKPVKVEWHQTSMFGGKSARNELDAALKAEAAKQGADAVINIKYDFNNGMFNKKGNFASGLAVKFADSAAAPAAPAPQQYAAAPAPAPTYAPAPAAAPPMMRTGPTPASAIQISEAGIGVRYVEVRAVKAEWHQKSMFGGKSARTELDNALRAEAAKAGADAVINVKYDFNSGLTSKKGNTATGMAVKFAEGAAAPAVPAASYAPAPTPTYAPAAAPIVRTGPTPAAAIMLSDGDVGGRYVRIRDIKAVVHQKSMFPKNPPRAELEQALRAEAAKAGADAVINVKYDMANAMMSKEGHIATGTAVRFVSETAAAAPAPVPAAAAGVAQPARAQQVASAAGPSASKDAPPPAYTPKPPKPAPPPPRTTMPLYPTPATLPPGVSRPAAATTASGQPVAHTAAADIKLVEADITDRKYVRLGNVRAEAQQTAIISSRPAKVLLDDSMRAQAEKLGADAVVMVKYSLSNPMFSKDGSTATGVAVKFQ